MAEHERATQGKNEKADQKHRVRQQESHPSFDTFHAWGQGLLSLTETPFYPRMDEHAAILSSIPFSAQRHEFIMRLHQTYGNRYVQRLVESVRAQAKLTVNAPNDMYEQEADRVADTVTRAVQTPVSRQEEEEELQMQEEEEELQTKPLNSVQRQEIPEEEEIQAKSLLQRQPIEEEEEELQKQPDESHPVKVSIDLETQINSARGGGQPISKDVREPMENAFGADFRGVRVHTDSKADGLSQELSAKAFTTGQDIFFRESEYSPASDSGRKLLAHELTHVVQQNNGCAFESIPNPLIHPTRSSFEPKKDVMALRKSTLRYKVNHMEGIQRQSLLDPVKGGIRTTIQAKKGDPANLDVGEWGAVGKGGRIQYTALAAGCLAVTVGFTDGGGAGVHLAIMMDHDAHWREFQNAIAGKSIATVYLAVDQFNDDDGWHIAAVRNMENGAIIKYLTEYTPVAAEKKESLEKRLQAGLGEEPKEVPTLLNEEAHVRAWFSLALGTNPAPPAYGTGVFSYNF
ncbi:DUF4157 domain-containing protein [Chloroflexota bacterium]